MFIRYIPIHQLFKDKKKISAFTLFYREIVILRHVSLGCVLQTLVDNWKSDSPSRFRIRCDVHSTVAYVIYVTQVHTKWYARMSLTHGVTSSGTACHGWCQATKCCCYRLHRAGLAGPRWQRQLVESDGSRLSAACSRPRATDIRSAPSARPSGPVACLIRSRTSPCWPPARWPRWRDDRSRRPATELAPFDRTGRGDAQLQLGLTATSPA